MARKRTQQEREARWSAIVERRNRGESQRQIAAALGISRGMVQKELRAMKVEQPQRVPARPARHSRAVQHVKTNSSGFLGIATGLQTILPPPDHFDRWRREGMDRDTWSKASATELVSLLINISPDVSRAVWDYLRLLNSGHEIHAYKPGTEDIDPVAEAALDGFIERLDIYYGSFKVVLGRLFMAAITRGAFFAELVLDDTGTLPVDISTPDPVTVRFRRAEDDQRGTYWQMGQWQGGKFVDFDMPTVRYIPVDPEAGSPYGRPMLAPAVFPAVFLIGLLHDLRRVVAQQGYPRTDIIVKLETLRAAYAGLAGMDEFEEKVDQLIETISAEYGSMEPDDAFVHTDIVDVERAGGVVDTSSMRGSREIIEALERMAMRAVKSTPLLMGIGEGQSEAKANREWEVYGGYIGTLQHFAETLISGLLTIALQVQGIAADAKIEFAPVRSADELRDEQVAQLKLGNALVAEQAGYVDHNEAAEYAVGHTATGDLTAASVTAPAPDASEVEAEPGGNRVTASRAVSAAERRDQIDRAVASWNRAFEGTKYVGMLQAPVVNGPDDGD